MIASVIVPTYNAQSILADLLQALLMQEGLTFGTDFEIIVVDDGSTDQTAQIAAGFGVRVVPQPNAGPAAARNHGARLAAAPLLVFTDSDCLPSHNWLSCMIAPFVDPEVVGVKGAYRTNEPGCMPRFVQAEYAFKYERMRKLPRIDFIDTYSAAYRRTVFLENHGFDENFPVPSVEDQDFSFRLARQGLKLVFQPSAVVFHRHDRTVLEYIKRKFGIGFWKAFLLRKLPEKALGDSHTSPSQPWEILAAGMIGAGLFLAVIHPSGWWLAGAGGLLFLACITPLLAFLSRFDPSLVWIAPGILMVRAFALGIGLVAGGLFPPRKH